jgi:hypothetical protein
MILVSLGNSTWLQGRIMHPWDQLLKSKNFFEWAKMLHFILERAES